MIKVYCADGAVFEGKTAKDVVDKMRLDIWGEAPGTNDEYMEQVARRAKIWDGWGIRYNNEEDFLSEMLRMGALKNMVIEHGD